MISKALLGICVVALTLAGCAPADHSVTPPPDELAKVKATPVPPEKSPKGKQSFSNVEKD